MVLEMEMSKTYQYRKVMKPMLERKRRARINKCLDELKDIMVECLTQEGEHITRLEKADILELTVEHMKKLKQQKQLKINNSNHHQQQQHSNNHEQQHKLSIAESFRAGYIHAANEVSKSLASVPGVSVELGTQLMSHLGHRLNYLQVVIPTTGSTGTITLNGVSSSSSSSSSSPQQEQHPSIILPQIIATHNPFSIGGRIGSYFEDNINNTSRSTPIVVITPPPSECSNTSDRGSCSPTPSETSTVWRPW